MRVCSHSVFVPSLRVIRSETPEDIDFTTISQILRVMDHSGAPILVLLNDGTRKLTHAAHVELHNEKASRVKAACKHERSYGASKVSKDR